MPNVLIFGISHTLHRSLHILPPRSHPPHIWGCISIVIATAGSPAGIWTFTPPTISPIKLFPPTSSLACLTLLHTPLHPIHHNICIRLKREERREEFLLFLFPPIFFQISNGCCSVLCARIKTVTICALIAANLATWIISNSNRVTVLHKEKPLLFLMNTLTHSPALSP